MHILTSAATFPSNLAVLSSRTFLSLSIRRLPRELWTNKKEEYPIDSKKQKRSSMSLLLITQLEAEKKLRMKICTSKKPHRESCFKRHLKHQKRMIRAGKLGNMVVIESWNKELSVGFHVACFLLNERP